MDAEKFLKDNSRSIQPGKSKTSHAREMRFKDELGIVDKHSLQFATGKIKDTDFIKLSDIKKFLAQNPNHGLDPASEMAQVQGDMVKLCVKGKNQDGKVIRLTAKTVGTNRVAYFNMQQIRELVAATKDKAQLKIINDRLHLINELPNRPGYASK